MNLTPNSIEKSNSLLFLGIRVFLGKRKFLRTLCSENFGLGHFTGRGAEGSGNIVLFPWRLSSFSKFPMISNSHHLLCETSSIYVTHKSVQPRSRISLLAFYFAVTFLIDSAEALDFPSQVKSLMTQLISY